MKIFFAAVIASACIASAAPASAQSYYMRERIKNISRDGVSTPAPTPTPATPVDPPSPSVTYSWKTGSWISSSKCTSYTSQHRSVQCVASTGGTVADSNCSSAKPAISQTGSDYTGCTYTLHDHGYGACTNGSRPHYRDCMRSDGTDGHYATNCSSFQNPTYESC